MLRTTNYNLYKPEDSDLADQGVDINANMDIIDGQMKSTADRATNLENRATSLESRATALENDSGWVDYSANRNATNFSAGTIKYRTLHNGKIAEVRLSGFVLVASTTTTSNGNISPDLGLLSTPLPAAVTPTGMEVIIPLHLANVMVGVAKIGLTGNVTFLATGADSFTVNNTHDLNGSVMYSIG